MVRGPIEFNDSELCLNASFDDDDVNDFCECMGICD